MPHKIIEVEGVAGKTVQRITATRMNSSFAISLSGFPTRQRFTLNLHPRIEAEPELVDWTTGDGETLKRYPTICEHEQ
jgi:hypothetical protein